MKENNTIAVLLKNLYGYFFNERRCVACHIPFHQVKTNIYLCNNCTTKIHQKPLTACMLCGHSVPSEAKICLECAKNPPPWDEISYYGLYDDLLKALILKYKFSADFSLIPLLSQYLEKSCLTLPPCHLLIAMPRHDKRLVSEGFNHILELCRPLAKQLQIPLESALIRTRPTPPQSTLPAKQRKNNPKKSFHAKNVNGKHILLIDDVITTGATLRHACLALRKAGAKKIYVALIARVEHM